MLNKVRVPELFQGIGCMDGEISIKLRGAISHTEQILHKVHIAKPIEWLNSFVYVKKPNGKIRLCLDPRHLNKWIICPRHSAKLVDDITQTQWGQILYSGR